MIISVGYFKLSKLAKLYSFLRLSKQIEQEALAAEGNIKVKLMGGNLSSFYVLTVWDSTENMMKFSRSGKHLEAIRKSKELSKEIRLLHYDSDAIPSDKEAKLMLQNNPKTRIL
jgi:heme-degrading monooxygenase HmoA